MSIKDILHVEEGKNEMGSDEYVTCKKCNGTLFKRTMIEQVKIAIEKNPDGDILGYNDELVGGSDDYVRFKCVNCGKGWKE